ncbi:Conserved_hypothetical protein [Hexamita inflata]|uniref:Uncharacterized protein n=1 Tax=Hexamita inflata TaxID=28002 RepID=A0AA86N498_9EUKA|nr:Conserved hypothetical protein [Hexamita inflata]
MSNQQSPISQINNSNNDQIDTIALRCEDTSLLPEHSDKNKQYNIISPRLSYWINIQRCWMCIIVIVAHITPSSYYEKSIATALIPHPFVAHGRAAVRMFFVFAAIFSMNSMQNLYEKHQDSTKQFTKALLYQYTKRYFQTHGILLVLGLCSVFILGFRRKWKGCILYSLETIQKILANVVPSCVSSMER